ncbi:MAG: ATP-binding protein [Myxococcales bacterium]|nr:response regulator [Myxococcales bacterium]
MDRRILAALDKAPATVVLLSGPELRYTWMNELFRKLFPRIQVGDAFGTVTAQSLQFRALAERVLQTGEAAVLHEVEVELAGRDDVWFDLLVHPVQAEGSLVVVGTNVTEVVKSRRALDEQAERTRLAEERLTALLDRGPFAVVSFDGQGRVLYSAGGQLRDVGLTAGETLFEQYRDDPGILGTLRRALTGEAFSALLPRPNGRIAEVHFSPVRAEGGGIDQVVAIGIDVTARQRAQEERARIQEKMLQTQKLESLGVLAGGIAHDFNNLLTVIQGNAAVALARLPDGHPVREPIDDIVGAAHRAADLTRQMLAYSGRGRFEIRPLDLRQQVREIANLLRSSIPKKVALRIDEPPYLPTVQGDPSQMHQVVMNLVLNAAEAIGERDGDVTVGLGEEEVGAEGGGDLVGRERLADGRYVRLTVSDTGTGMDEKVRSRIFDPFFTTKSTGRGLGLAAVLGIVRGHGGALRIDSTPGRGTRFDVLLPAAGARAYPAKSGEPSASRGRGTILVIDDEEHVRVATARLLSAMGYDVLEASDGEQGAEIFKLRGGTVNAVVLDLTMPHLSGEETLALLRTIDPAVRVVFFSGYAENELAERLEPLHPAAVLHKPFTRQQLAAAVEAALA